ncbi:hypothetical protein BO70DRAFT_373623 [Aspergillus heteromorphus CBS 117.55]|uniref:Uncharacterized protein n=1 Tax=Aspergillus heteromorphus CBS 117.55 TaxID=1448321 RepID=A0A317VE95_9EURO|nr:uncharacterized protein BO70DRAFT_373623 [Aspergillus heteromorphus CBS 117.55]PWY71759.1 hypothetical protein BO70DRAFT_373623 [Aspergillus heteromorphus CBS 117.55]
MLASSIHRRPPVLAPRSPSDDNAGQKRTAAGVAKGLSDTSGVAHVGVGVERRRSRSIGSLSRESKIAALSVHLRTRLSYAAAKIEKNRKTHTHGHSRSPSTDSPIKIEHLVSLGEPETQQLVALNPPPTSHTHPLNGPARLSPVAWSAEASPSPPDPKPHLPVQARPKLAPPADIIASAGSSSSRRRRPNPNEVTKPTHFPPFLHRRHHSQQEFGVSRPAANLERVLVPGTPPLRPSSQNTSTPTPTPTPYNGSSAMEQDAIETLLFMSSPGHSHSGYHSSQPSQRHLPFQSSSDSRGSDARVPCSQDSHVGADHGRPVYGFRGQSIGLEAQAGDEIDRMLDQMDSDSDDEFEGGSGE